jgi:DNA-binding MarR family transcriptional regulator
LTHAEIGCKIHLLNFEGVIMPNAQHELLILEEIKQNPDTTQAGLAAKLGIAVGSVNWVVTRLITKGYIKVTHLQRRKLHYFLTPSGLALKLKLTKSYMDVSLRVYRELRQAAQTTLSQVRQAGYSAVWFEDEDEATEILRLTCMEQGLKVQNKPTVPQVHSTGTNFEVIWPDGARVK